MTEKRLLIIEDDPGLQKQMRWCFEDITIFAASNLKQAEGILRREEPQVITLDLGLPPDPGGTSQGFACLELIQQLLPATKVIVITGREEREAALAAVEHGAYDFYQKPIESEILQFIVDRAFKLWELESENRRLVNTPSGTPLEGFITADKYLLSICHQVERVSPAEVAVMILGETGTGKEIVARNIHELSDRSEQPFIAINCAAIPENLLENELFGHEKGAFTGAVNLKVGRIEAAHGGTLFLDEIGDMPLPLQAKILRFLQERSFDRIGGSTLIEADVRLVSATHNDLQAMIAAGTFREDLYYRLAEITITLPPLRDRGDDAVLIGSHLLRRATSRQLRLSREAQDAIRAHDWPGNIRELENRIKRASILCENSFINPVDLELSEPIAEDIPLNLKLVRATAERQAIQKAMSRAQSNVSQAARMLGVSRPTLYNLFEKHNIQTNSHS